jgi:conjugative relaxase-like TrwC/TraI family protein
LYVLTISRLSRWSINYYNDTANQAKQTAMNRQRANGGLGEYYTEGDTRVPTWLVVGDAAAVAERTGLDGAALDGGFVDTETAARWLDDGIAPNGARGRAFTTGSVHGFDLTFAAPKSVSLLRALTSDLNEKSVLAAHHRALSAAMEYLHEHAGYTRVHNPQTGNKDLQRLPGLAAIAYQHETSRCGDPHLHTHVIVPNRQVRADGALVSLDSKSLFHEAKAAGVVYQAMLRHELHVERGVEWVATGDRTSGMAEVAGITTAAIKAWSQRKTRLMEWARKNLVVVDGAAPSAAQLASAQKATRPAKPESRPWDELQDEWRADARGLEIDRAAHHEARRAREAAPDLGAQLADMVARIDKPTFTRADLVELVGALMPVDAPGDPRELIDAAVDRAAVRVSAERQAHQREGHVRYTVDAVMREEQRVLDMVDDTDERARVDVRTADLGDLSHDQARVVGNIAASPYLVCPLQAPAGAGKTHSLKALRAGAHRGGKEVLVLAPTGKAVDEAMRDGASDRGMTIANALRLIADDQLRVDRGSVVVVDETAMVGTDELNKLLAATTAGRAKTVLVGDSYQLAPVKARGGMFEQLCDELPWAQRLSQVWRMREAGERDACLALRAGHGNRLRKAVGWYRSRDRLHTGDAIAMADDATDTYIAARRRGDDAAIMADTRAIADAINQRLHDHYTDPTAASMPVARDQRVRVGDIIISRNNDATIRVDPGQHHRAGDRIDQVRNGNRWRVIGINARTGRIGAERLTDEARAVFEGDYLREHITLGYATTVHAAQGITVGDSTRRGIALTLLSEQASRSLAYVGMTRGKDENHAYIYQPSSEASEHQHDRTTVADTDIHVLQRGTKHQAAQRLRVILANDDRARTMHTEAERTERHRLPDRIAALLDRNDQRRRDRTQAWRDHTDQTRAREATYQRITEEMRAADHQRSRHRGRSRGGYGLEL